MLRKLIGLTGLLTLVFVVANVHFGAMAPYVIEGAPNSRLDVLRLADPGCTIPEMEKEIRQLKETLKENGITDLSSIDETARKESSG